MTSRILPFGNSAFDTHSLMWGALAQTLTPLPPLWEVQNIEEVWTTFGPTLAPKAPETFYWHTAGGGGD